jgi:alpha-beta hydrolase superfamily lysophospholipase
MATGTDGSQLLSRVRPNDPALRYELHRPAGPARGAVLLTHGFGEHRLRYAEVVRRWNERGLLVATWDLRGHGGSEGRRSHVDRFADYVLDAIELLDALDREPAWRALGKPTAFGHSLGGLITVHLGLAMPRRLRGVALSSPFLGLALDVPAVKRIAGLTMSRLVPTFALPTGLAGADVTRDPAIAAAYDSDPLVGKVATARWFTEATGAQRSAFERAAAFSAPLFVLHGGADKVASCEATERWVAAAGSAEKSFQALPGLYHEILNEPERATWIDAYADAMLGWAGRSERETA